MSRDVHRLGCHCYLWHKPIISIFRIFRPKVIESSFDANLFLFAKCARAYETWKQCQWIMRTLTCKHKTWGENWLYLRPYLKAFSLVDVLETFRVYLLAIDLGIVKFIKKIIERFFEKCENCSMDQITCKNCNKSSWMQVSKILLTRDRPEQFPFFLVRSFQWNQTTMMGDEAAFPKLIIFFKI